MTLTLSLIQKGKFSITDTGAEIVIRKGEEKIPITNWEELRFLRDLMHQALPPPQRSYPRGAA